MVKPFLLVFMLLSFSLFAHDFSAGKIEVNHPWARPTAPVVKTGAVYLVIKNPTHQAELLLSVEVPSTIAEMAQIHQTKYSQNMAKMREAHSGLLIPAENSLEFIPGGNHIMLVGLKAPLIKGEKFPMKLHFEHSGEITVEVWVEEMLTPNAATSNHSIHSHH
jgi:copper(I)-binding protein